MRFAHAPGTMTATAAAPIGGAFVVEILAVHMGGAEVMAPCGCTLTVAVPPGLTTPVGSRWLADPGSNDAECRRARIVAQVAA